MPCQWLTPVWTGWAQSPKADVGPEGTPKAWKRKTSTKQKGQGCIQACPALGRRNLPLHYFRSHKKEL